MVFKQEDFTEQAQETIAASYDVVRRFKHPQWDVEHVVVALLETEKSVPVQLLNRLGANVDQVVRELQSVLSATPQLSVEPTQIHPTPRVLQLLEAAKQEA